ncbi:MAG: S9 family peptidase, partial [Verrucomicrobiaceae bacterium]
YLEFRAAALQSWHPQRREMLITTRFAETPQLHLVRQPGGARRQLTFSKEPVRGAAFRPGKGDSLIYSQDTGGGEFFQLYHYSTTDGRSTLLTDGKSRNTGAVWAKDGSRLAWTSTKRNGKDNDIWIMDPDKPAEARLLTELSGGGWGVTDWSPDGTKLAVVEFISANLSRLWLVDAATGAKEQLTPDADKPVARSGGKFSRDGKALFFTSDENGEFHQLMKMNLADRKLRVLTREIPWDIEAFDPASDGGTVALASNEAGLSVLYTVSIRTVIGPDGAPMEVSTVPKKITGETYGVVSSLQWHENGRDLGFTLTSARSPSDAYSIEINPENSNGEHKIERWTESETGGLNTGTFSEPELVKVKSFDGLEVSGFLYRPDPNKFPGKR